MSHPHVEANETPTAADSAPLSDSNGLDHLIQQASPNLDKPPVTPPGETPQPSADEDPPPATPEDPPASAEVSQAAQKTQPDDTSKDKPAAKVDKSKASPANQLDSKVKGLEKWNQRLAQQNTALAKHIDRLEKKIDGIDEEPATPKTEDAIKQSAKFEALEEASRTRANTLHGKDHVDSQIYNDGAPYLTLVAEKPWVHQQVMASTDPTEEALRLITLHEFFDKYGNDPAVIEQTLTETIRAQVLEELKSESGKKKLGESPPNLSDVRSPEVDNGKPKHTPFRLSSINPGFA